MMKSLLKSFRPVPVLSILAFLFLSAFTVEAVHAQDSSLAMYEGEYSGQIYLDDNSVEAIIHVTSSSENEYQATLHVEESGQETIELSGTYRDYTLRFSNNVPLRFQYILGRITALDEENNYMGHLDRVVRVAPDN